MACERVAPVSIIVTSRCDRGGHQMPICFRTTCLVALLSYCTLASAQYTPQAPRTFSIPDSQPRTGTNLKGRSAIGDIPFDKRYSELTAEQKNKFKIAISTHGRG